MVNKNLCKLTDVKETMKMKKIDDTIDCSMMILHGNREQIYN